MKPSDSWLTNTPLLKKNWSLSHRHLLSTPAEAVKDIQSGQRLFIGTGAATPQVLLQALSERADDLYDTELFHILTLGGDPTTNPEYFRKFRHSTFFIGANVRDAVRECRADYTPIFLSEIPRLFQRGAIPLDVALIQVSPPDEEGRVSLGVSVDIVRSAVSAAKMVVAEVNPQMPRTCGDTTLSLDEIDRVVLWDSPLLEFRCNPPSDVSRQIGKFLGSLIEDGSTIQVGLGSIPNSVWEHLENRKHLGLHMEMINEEVIPLIEKGVIDNSEKKVAPGRSIASFALGRQELYQYIDGNDHFEFRPSEFVNDPFVIAQNPKMVAINAAIEVDLTGQVCADSIGQTFYSGIGGQLDFIRGAARSDGGKPVIAMPSTTSDGTKSRIVLDLTTGSGVVTTRGDVHYIVTEYGIAYLHGKNIRHRALSLIALAHPKFRAKLLEGAKERGYVEPEQTIVTDSRAPYPVELEKRVQSRDSREFLFRPIKKTDEDLLKELFYGLSDQTLYYRFFTTPKYPPKDALQYLVNIDYEEAMALVIVDESEGREKIMGGARYYLDQHTGLAECSILVHDDLQGQGLGKSLFYYLVEIAKARQVKGFTADMLAENRKMFHLLESVGDPSVQDVSYGVGHVEFVFRD